MDQHSGYAHHQEHRSSSLPWVLGSAALGALAMYMTDPNRGRRRRALAADQVRSATARAREVVGMAGRDLNNRLHGLAAQAKRLVPGRADTVDDPVLQARVRQKIGRMVSNPHAIKVNADGGYITLHGPVLEAEHRTLLNTVRAVPGVTAVEDHLDARDVLPGVTMRLARRDRDDTPRNDWPPAARALTLLGGGALSALGLLRRSPWASVLALAGLGLMARSFAQRPGATSAGATGARAIDVHKVIHIDAAPEAVYDLMSNYENFPRFMSHVREVRDLGNGRSHWKVEGPAGVKFEWDAELTRSQRPEALAWHSVGDASVPNSGAIHFEPAAGGTRVAVHLSYVPPAGALGQAVSELIGGDPKRQLEDDLLRMKEFIETGRVPPDAARRGEDARGTLH